LQNSETLKAYKIENESVIHLVAKTDEPITNNQTENSNTTGTGIGTGSSEQGSSRTVDRVDGDFLPLIEIPVLRSARRNRRRRSIYLKLNLVPHFDISECFEAMHQNISTLDNILNCRGKFEEQTIKQDKTIVPYDFTKSKYDVGQWIDVKDTIDQWLEAQVIQVRGNQVYVHYNGWGTRWDEWIDCDSSRIASFK
jgi:hypothetical protein